MKLKHSQNSPVLLHSVLYHCSSLEESVPAMQRRGGSFEWPNNAFLGSDVTSGRISEEVDVGHTHCYVRTTNPHGPIGIIGTFEKGLSPLCCTPPLPPPWDPFLPVLSTVLLTRMGLRSSHFGCEGPFWGVHHAH